MNILLLALYFGVPLVLQRLEKRVLFIEKIGVVTLCYALGLLLGNLPGFTIDESFVQIILQVVVPLSIPLILFSSDFKAWLAMGPTMAKAFIGLLISVALATLLGTYFFEGKLEEGWKIGGMMMGVYTGGTPNMSAIGISLGVEDETFVLLNAADLLICGAFLLFLLGGAKQIYSKFLHPSRQLFGEGLAEGVDEKMYWPSSLIALGLAALAVALCAGISYLIFGHLHEVTILLGITTCGVLASLNRRIRTLPGSFGLGNYLLLVFCVAVASLASLSKIADAGPALLSYVAVIIAFAVGIHLLLSRLMHIDVDTVIISCAAGLYGPAFIAPVARAIKNAQIIPLGIAVSLLGLAVGNYCGIAMAQLLRVIF